MQKLFWILLLSFRATIGGLHASQSATQVIDLRSGWNLISIQVGAGITPSQFRDSLGADSAKLTAIWEFGSPVSPGTAPWQWKFFHKEAAIPSDLALLQPGKGYWVQVSSVCSVTLVGTPWDGNIQLKEGWNLAGFPGITTAESEVQELSSLFGTHFDKVTQVWSWDAAAQRFVGYDITSIPQMKELVGVEAGHGYWVYSLETTSLTAVPSLALPGDADASPLQNETAIASIQELTPATGYFGPMTDPERTRYAAEGAVRFRGAEDVAFDLNANGLLDSPFTQDTLLFDVGVDRKIVSIANRGDGLFNWSVENDIDWLFTEAADEKAHPSNAGRAKASAGTVSSETDAVTLYADTRGLLPGRHSGQIVVHLGNTTRIITVLLDVPTSSGDWKGYASTQRVNGKNIGIGAVDMGLNLFMLSDAIGESRFRAVLNKDTSLLFPRDVFMNGVFYSGNEFSLTTNFELPPADRNAPPFDTFPAKRAASDAVPPRPADGTALARTDYDLNGNGKVDVDNPFPFALHREITLRGTRLTPNRMEGSYIESITGMLPLSQPIFIEGTFFLDRQTYQPTKRSIFNQPSTGTPILIGGTSGQLFRDTTINVPNAVSIQGVTVGLNVNFPSATVLTITLTGPNGQVVTLHRQASSIPASIDLADFNGIIGQGTWKLRVAWTSTPERGFFNGWNLNIQGLATYSVSGKIVGDLNGDAVPEPLPGTHLVLSGSNLIEQADTGPFQVVATTTAGSTSVALTSGTTASFFAGMAVGGNSAIPGTATVATVIDSTHLTLSSAATATASAPTTFGLPGQFTIGNLTENHYTLTITRPGFESRAITFFLNNGNLYVRNGPVLSGVAQGSASTTPSDATTDPVVLTATGAASPELRPGPALGQEPLFVNFSALVPLADLNAIGTITSAEWNFGDGGPSISAGASTDDAVAETSAKHLYEKAGDYTPTLVLTGTSGSRTIPGPNIHVQRIAPDPRPDAPAVQLIGAGFVGAMAAPVDNAGAPVALLSQNAETVTTQVRQAAGAFTTMNLDTVPSAIVPQESKRDTASFDIDRPPLIISPSGADFHLLGGDREDTDFTGQFYVGGDGSVTLPWVFRAFDPANDPPGDFSTGYSEYQPEVIAGSPNIERFRIFTTLGGAVFGAEPARVGNLILQSGRVER